MLQGLQQFLVGGGEEAQALDRGVRAHALLAQPLQVALTDKTHCYNPMSYIRADPRHVVGDVLSIAQIIYPTEVRGSGTEGFFNDQARNLFLGLVLYLARFSPGSRLPGT